MRQRINAPIDAEQLIDKFISQATALGACDLFTDFFKDGRHRSIDALAHLVFTPQGIEFCTKNQFPTLPTFRQFKQFGLEEYGIFVDAGEVALCGVPQVLLVGRTFATLSYSETKRYEVALMHGAKAVVNASGWSVVDITGGKGCDVQRRISDNAYIF